MKAVDFSQGVQATQINKNFKSLQRQLSEERLSTAGSGFVDGFRVTPEGNLGLAIEGGRYINTDGKEILKDPEVVRFNPPHPRYYHQYAQVSSDGVVELYHKAFNAVRQRYYNTTDYLEQYPHPNFVIQESNLPSNVAQAIRVETNIPDLSVTRIELDAEVWAGRTVNVQFYYAEERVDLLLINKEGEYSVIEGLDSVSPSKTDLSEYRDSTILGIARIMPGHTASSLSFDGERKQYRNIFTDEHNNLILCGENYTELMTEFKNRSIIPSKEAPIDPIPNTLWYDIINNKLMSWNVEHQIQDWIPVNDVTIYPIIEIKHWGLNEMPDDLQTFYFERAHEQNSGDRQRLQFPIGKNALEIIVDNAPLMSDQYKEIKDPDHDVGIGFELNEPLDKPAFVEVRVTHRVNEGNLKHVFQRAATFTQEGHIDKDSSDFSTPVFELDGQEYQAGENQLELYRNGVLLRKEVDYIEYDNKQQVAVTRGDIADSFRLTNSFSLKEDDWLFYRISKNVFGYDHLEEIFDNISEQVAEERNRIDQALQDIQEIEESIGNQLTTLNEDIQASLNNLGNTLNAVQEQMLNVVMKDDAVSIEQLNAELRGRIPKDTFKEERTASQAIIPFAEISLNDFLIVSWGEYATDHAKILLEHEDYTLEQRPGGGINVLLNSAYLGANKYIRLIGITFGW